VITTQSSAEAFRLYSSSPDSFDLVITDLTMPQMTGIELARKINALDSSVPIILCTGYNDFIDQETISHYGINEILLKPVSMYDFAKTIRQVLDQ